MPFPGAVVANLVQDEEQSVGALYDYGNQERNGWNRWHRFWVGAAGGGPVVKTGCVETESPLM